CRRVGDDVESGGFPLPESGAHRGEQCRADALTPPGSVDGDGVEVIGLHGPSIDGIPYRCRPVDGTDAAGPAAGDVVELALERGAVAIPPVLHGPGEQAGSTLHAGRAAARSLASARYA